MPCFCSTYLIGLITGAIIAVITCIYVGYSASLFINRVTNIYKLYPNKAYLKWKDGKYRSDYDEEKAKDDPDIAKAKYRDLGKKQYNYNSEYYKLYKDRSSEINTCSNPASLSSQKGSTNIFGILLLYIMIQ